MSKSRNVLTIEDTATRKWKKDSEELINVENEREKDRWTVSEDLRKCRGLERRKQRQANDAPVQVWGGLGEGGGW